MDKSINYDKLMRDVNKNKCKVRIERELVKEDNSYRVVNTRNIKKQVTINRLNNALDFNVNRRRLVKNNSKKQFMENIKPYVISEDEFGNIVSLDNSSKSKKPLTPFSSFAIIFIFILLVIIFFMEYYGFTWNSSLF